MKKSKWVVLLLMVMFVFGGCGASTKESEGITQNRSADTAAVSFESEGEKARLDARETQVPGFLLINWTVLPRKRESWVRLRISRKMWRM